MPVIPRLTFRLRKRQTYGAYAEADERLSRESRLRNVTLGQAEIVLIFVARGRSPSEDIQLIADDDQEYHHD
jgi:hypothetical protein